MKKDKQRIKDLISKMTSVKERMEEQIFAAKHDPEWPLFSMHDDFKIIKGCRDLLNECETLMKAIAND